MLLRLHRDGQLKLQGPWSPLREPAAFAAWLQTFRDSAWVVYIEPPPTAQANPEQVLKYLARYLTGGPISDQRLLAHQGDQVTFWRVAQTNGTGTSPHPIRSTESSSPAAGRCTFCRKASSNHAVSAASVAGGGRLTSDAVAHCSAWSTPHPRLPTRSKKSPSSSSPVPSVKRRWNVFPTSSVPAGNASSTVVIALAGTIPSATPSSGIACTGTANHRTDSAWLCTYSRSWHPPRADSSKRPLTCRSNATPKEGLFHRQIPHAPRAARHCLHRCDGHT